MQDSFDFTTLIFLGLAIFVAWKLRSVLGQKTGAEKPPLDRFRAPDEPPVDRVQPTPPAGRTTIPSSESNVIRLPGAANDLKAANPPALERWQGTAARFSSELDAILAKEPDFSLETFLGGAKSAYEYIVTAFDKGDRKALKPLLAKDVFDGFDEAIAAREKKGEKVETTFVSIDKAELERVDIKGATAQVTVRFASKLISATRDAGGSVIMGDASTVADITDIWTFSRQLGNRDPNWILVATGSAN